MASCIQELIVAWIKTKLTEVCASGVLVAVERPVRGGIPSRPRHRLAVLHQDDPQPDEATHGAAYWIMPLAVDLYLRPADGSTTPVDTDLNDLRAFVEKKLTEDITCGGYAHTLTIKAPEGFIEGEGFEGVRVNLDVQFGTLENDPFTKV